MKWKNEYDVTDIYNDLDRYGIFIKRGDKVVWAASSSVGRPYLCEGTIIGFTKHPSFTYAVIKSNKNRIVKKIGSQVIKIYDRYDGHK